MLLARKVDLPFETRHDPMDVTHEDLVEARGKVCRPARVRDRSVGLGLHEESTLGLTGSVDAPPRVDVRLAPIDDADVAEFLLKNDQAYDHIDAFRKGSPDGMASLCRKLQVRAKKGDLTDLPLVKPWAG